MDKNESKVLNILLDRGNVTNHKISEEIGLHHQTVGKIRKKIEEKLGIRYTVEFDYDKIGLTSMYYIYTKIYPRGKTERKRERARNYFDERDYFVGYGAVSHAVWDGYVILTCKDDEFDRIFRNYKEVLGGDIEDISVVKHTYTIGRHIKLQDGLRRHIKEKILRQISEEKD